MPAADRFRTQHDGMCHHERLRQVLAGVLFAIALIVIIGALSS